MFLFTTKKKDILVVVIGDIQHLSFKIIQINGKTDSSQKIYYNYELSILKLKYILKNTLCSKYTNINVQLVHFLVYISVLF